jgi:ATP-dependent DNA helicase RecQ
VLTTPERLSDPAFLDALGGKNIDVFVMDEAHCISQGGPTSDPTSISLMPSGHRAGRVGAMCFDRRRGERGE